MTPSEQQRIVRAVVNQVAQVRGLPAPYPDASGADLPAWVTDTMASADLATWGAAELGAVRERLVAEVDRKSGGIWYTPPELAAAITRFALSITSYPAGYDVPGYTLRVLALDPACGAGVFLVAAARDIATRYAAACTGLTPPPAWAVATVMPTVLTECVYGVDIDAVAVDLARAACWLETGGAAPPTFMDDNITVGDPLADEIPKRLQDRLGTDPDPLYIIGNPPYRDKAKGAAPWIEERRRGGGDELFPRPSMDEFRVPGNGRLEYVLSNLAAFFWRWAIWKALEVRDWAGTVAFITPSAYLNAPAYGGMRRHFREVAREGWIIDLSPEGRQPPKETRLFLDVQTPLAAGVFTTHIRPGYERAQISGPPPGVGSGRTSQEVCAAASPEGVRARIIACAEANDTVEEIAEDTGWSVGAVREVLVGAGMEASA